MNKTFLICWILLTLLTTVGEGRGGSGGGSRGGSSGSRGGRTFAGGGGIGSSSSKPGGLSSGHGFALVVGILAGMGFLTCIVYGVIHCCKHIAEEMRYRDVINIQERQPRLTNYINAQTNSNSVERGVAESDVFRNGNALTMPMRTGAVENSIYDNRSVLTRTIGTSVNANGNTLNRNVLWNVQSGDLVETVEHYQNKTSEAEPPSYESLFAQNQDDKATCVNPGPLVAHM
ncbi:hypothetical protein MAR_026718 [Mya arenaria]|uniref:Uncharacterized protein n=1 Tax=Mya arenaria TaxID=6604 RepID=A0ABY7ERG1_MYAAR|nr:uncharacterized protein LOC128245049 [Mya arenaria]WAR12538.1 hypothetical protein MAR_026718 [Mya arenaria]